MYPDFFYLLFFLLRERFFGFLVVKISCIFPVFSLERFGFLKRLEREPQMFGTNLSGGGASVTPRSASSLHRGDRQSLRLRLYRCTTLRDIILSSLHIDAPHYAHSALTCNESEYLHTPLVCTPYATLRWCDTRKLQRNYAL